MQFPSVIDSVIAMAKIGPKELERRALRENDHRPRVISPSGKTVIVNTVAPGEVERALAFYRKHRERQRLAQKRRRDKARKAKEPK